jgi:parallel beta-helix repeat protein
MRHFFLALTIVFLLALTGAPVAAPGEQTRLNCGDRVMQSTKLAADVDCTGLTLGSAVFVVGNDVTLDLNGHTIQGPSNPASVSTFGVVVRGSGVTVKNGTVRGFYVDVFASGGDPTLSVAEARFDRLTLTDAATAISIYASDAPEVRRNVISGVQRGVAFSSSEGGVLTANSIIARGRTGDPGCASEGPLACIGIELGGGGGGALLRDNTIDSGGAGIGLHFRDSADTAIDNTIACVADCIVIANSTGGSVLDRNSATATEGASIRIDGGSGYAVKRNTVSGSVNANGIALSGVHESTVTDNITDGNGGFGLFVSGVANVLERNIANANDLDGIVSVGANTLTAKTARRNGGLGIYAREGAIDGGRNRAAGNSEPQCVGVTCTP